MNKNEVEELDDRLVSVIMPTYNAGRFLAASIESVLAQTYSNLELVITDDGSTDEQTLETLRVYKEKDSRVRVYYNKENMGAGPSRNFSTRQARGRYIAFCDSDDRWMPDKLEKQLAFMQERHCRLTYASYILCDDDDREKGIFIAPQRITYAGMLRDDKIGCLTAIYDAKALGRKFYMPALRKRQDWALFVMILRQCRVAYGLKEPLAYYRLRSNSISRNKWALIRYNANVYREVLGYSRFRAYAFLFTFFLPTYALKIIKRKYDSVKYLRGIGSSKTNH